MARSLQSRRDLSEISAISPRSRRDLESKKHHGEISPRSRQSRRDLVDLGEISPISARSRWSRRDLGKNFAQVLSHRVLILPHASNTLLPVFSPSSNVLLGHVFNFSGMRLPLSDVFRPILLRFLHMWIMIIKGCLWHQPVFSWCCYTVGRFSL